MNEWLPPARYASGGAGMADALREARHRRCVSEGDQVDAAFRHSGALPPLAEAAPHGCIHRHSAAGWKAALLWERTKSGTLVELQDAAQRLHAARQLASRLHALQRARSQHGSLFRDPARAALRRTGTAGGGGGIV